MYAAGILATFHTLERLAEFALALKMVTSDSTISGAAALRSFEGTPSGLVALPGFSSARLALTLFFAISTWDVVGDIVYQVPTWLLFIPLLVRELLSYCGKMPVQEDVLLLCRLFLVFLRRS